MRLFHKLLIFNLLGKGFLLLIFLMSGPLILRYFILKNTDLELEEKKNQVLELIQQEGIQSFFSEDEPDVGFGSYNILKEEYILMERAEEGFSLSSNFFTEKRIIEDQEITYRVFGEIIHTEDGDFLLEIGKSLSTIEEIESIFFRISIGILVLFLIFSAVLDTGISQVIMKPFEKIIRTKITQIHEPQQFSQEPINSTTQEFLVLDEAISEMMKRIQRSFNQERIFISHASHELKTPISVLQSKLEMFFQEGELSFEQQEKLMEMQNTLQKMKKSVNALLLLSKVNNAQFLKKESVNLKEVLEELTEDWSGIAKNQGLTLQVSSLEGYELEQTNSSLLTMMIQNALSNAVRYASPESILEFRGYKKEVGYEVEVINRGEPMDPKILKQVEEGTVFLKDANRESSGFGLQIMFKIAIFLGVTLSISSSEGQTSVKFIFPKKDF